MSIGTSPSAPWDAEPTAMEAAHYDALLRSQNDSAERRRQELAERSRTIFGDCLLRLCKLGMRETSARSMLGKWRGQTKDDDLLVRIVRAASDACTPDPVSYVTKALAGAKARSEAVSSTAKGEWVEIGWEAPKRTPRGSTWTHGVRGRVWRDPYGKLKVLPVKEGTVPPGLDDEPGVEIA